MMKKLIFIEHDPLFNRLDIIDRIIDLSRRARFIDETIIIYPYRESHRIHLVKRNCGEQVVSGSMDYVVSIVKSCETPVVLHENGIYDPYIVVYGDCYLAGIHSDIPLSFLQNIFDGKYWMIKLSNMNYLASQIIPVIEYIHEAYDTLLMLK